MDIERVYRYFYRVPRLGQQALSDGGGPFGFDVTMALEFDYLISRYHCDALIETGCHTGDTTAYLSSNYCDLPIITCDIRQEYTDLTRRRLGLISNVTVEHADSRDIVRKYKDRFRFPIYYLDAHWIDDSAIDGELSLIKRGIVCIGDFDIEHPRFSYDNYTDGKLDAARIKKSVSMLSVYYTNNPDAIYELPCLQTGRRGGRAYLVLGEEQDYLQYCRYFARHELQPG